MTFLVPAIVRAIRRRRALAIALVFALSVLSAAGIRRITFDTDVLSLLPTDGRTIPAFRTFIAEFGSLDQLYVVFTAPDGHTISEYRDDVDGWVEALRELPEIERVDSGEADRARDYNWLAERQLLILPPGSLDKALLRLTPDGIRKAVAASRELLTVPSSDVAALVRQDPVGLFEVMREGFGGSQPGINLGPTGEGLITADGRARLVLARPRRPPYDAAFSRALATQLTRLSSERASVQASTDSFGDTPLEPMSVAFAGGHRIAVETEAVVRRESILNSVGSLSLILPLLFLVFRSFWLVVVGALPSALSLVVVLGALGYTGAHLSAAATGSAAMLFGLGVDGVVLVYVAHQLALAERPDEEPAIDGPITSMLLGMFTTAATFYGLMFVDFPSLHQLGLLIGHSMVACGLLTLVIVTALLPRRLPRGTRQSLRMPALAAWIAKRRVAILWTAAGLTIAFGAAATRWLKVDPTLDRLRSTTDAARLEEQIGPMFGLPGELYVVLAGGTDLDNLLEANERLTESLSRELPDLQVQPPSRLLPSAAAQRRSIARISAAGLRVESIRESLEKAGAEAGFTLGAFAPFAERLPALLDPGQRLTYDDYVSRGATDLIDRFVIQDGGRWSLATYVFPKSEEEAVAVERIVEQVDPSQTLTGLPLVNRELARRFVPDFIKGLTIGTITVVLLVALAFRNWRSWLYALLPTAIGLMWTAGVLAIAGVDLDLFAIFAVVTFVGIGVDYGIHLVHRVDERQDVERATAELAPVILVAGAITILGYGTLVWSSYAPLRSIGIVSAVSVVALVSVSVLVLPALMLGGFGRRR